MDLWVVKYTSRGSRIVDLSGGLIPATNHPAARHSSFISPGKEASDEGKPGGAV